MLSVAIVFLRCEVLGVRFCKRSLYKGSFVNFSKNCSTVEVEEKGTGRKWGKTVLKT